MTEAKRPRALASARAGGNVFTKTTSNSPAAKGTQGPMDFASSHICRHDGVALTTSFNKDGRFITMRGRWAWALLELIRAGASGCTPISCPAPRWAAYVHKLRSRYGLEIETVREAHGGKFPGFHARYILRSVVEIISNEAEGRRDD